MDGSADGAIRLGAAPATGGREERLSGRGGAAAWPLWGRGGRWVSERGSEIFNQRADDVRFSASRFKKDHRSNYSIISLI